MTYRINGEPIDLDFPIGSKILHKGDLYVVKQAEENAPCEGCAFDNGDKCPGWLCSQEDRADKKDVIFEWVE